MSKLQTLKRARRDACIPNVQRRLVLRFPDEGSARGGNNDDAIGVIANPIEFHDFRSGSRAACSNSPGLKLAEAHPLTYRKVIAGWTDDWRERWGYRANSLEDIGLGWRDAETQAFVEILNQIRETAGSVPGRDQTRRL